MRNIKLQILVDNYHDRQNLKPGKGFACLITGYEKNILLDTGPDGQLLLFNMKQLQIDPETIDTVVLSHNHYDHTGGLHALLTAKQGIEVIIPGSFPPDIKKQIHSSWAKLTEVTQPLEICPGVHTTGEVSSPSAEGKYAQIKEQGLILEASRGLMLITGCAHPGIITMIESVEKSMSKNVLFAIGGFHLRDMNYDRLKTIAEDLIKHKVNWVAPCHCSGDLTRDVFKRVFFDRFKTLGTGSLMNFTSPV